MGELICVSLGHFSEELVDEFMDFAVEAHFL